MTHTIWKYPIGIKGTFTLELPHGARFLDIQWQRKLLNAWFMVDPEAPKAVHKFRFYGTGHPIDIDPARLTHLGTVQDYGGLLVFHLFEEAP